MVTGGAFLTPEVSFDGKTILFAWTDAVDKTWHIMKVNSDGSNLVALTDGLSGMYFSPLMDSRQEDFDPCWLPSGRIAFISERRGGYGRCHTYEKPTFTLYSMKADGTDMYPISYHETNEWNPSVANDGNLVFSRWDYIDRDDCVAHHLWVCGPDGSDPRAPHGNYPLPLSTMTGSNWTDGRWLRPNAEFQFRACPAPSMKYVATAGSHHSPIVGEIILIDPTIRDDGKMSQIKGITTNLTRWWDGLNSSHDYATPWPLSEQVFLCGKGSDLIYLDKNGNQQILYHNSSGWRAQDPIPLIARTKPPELASKTWQGARAGRADHYRATLGVLDVRVGDMSLRPQDTVVSMRIVQVIPQENAVINEPRVGYASESLVRLSLGTVPVEADGSVYCEAPVGKEIYFQLLDKRGLAVRSMRSGTFVHAGEQLTCVGCHEDKWTAPPPLTSRIAFKRPPSRLVPEIGTKVEPVGFYRTAKPVFDAKCTPCHLQKAKGPNGTYASFKDYAFWWPGEGNPFINGDIVTPIRGGSRCLPGLSGAMYAQLTKHLDSTHYNVKLTDEMFRRVTLWLDLNSNELTSASASRIPDMKLGKLVWPAIDIDTNNLHGIEMDRPVPGTVAIDAPSEVRTLKATPDISVSRYGNVISIAHRSGKITEISLFNVSGRCVFSRMPGTAVSRYTFSTTELSLPKSTYILKVTGDNRKQSIVRILCY